MVLEHDNQRQPKVLLQDDSGTETDETLSNASTEYYSSGTLSNGRRLHSLIISVALVSVLLLLCIGCLGVAGSRTRQTAGAATDMAIMAQGVPATAAAPAMAIMVKGVPTAAPTTAVQILQNQSPAVIKCTSNSSEDTCKLLMNFNNVWNTANSEQCQKAMDMYTPKEIGVELALSKTSYVLIYHDNVGYRFGEYISSGEFNFDTDPATQWTVRQPTADEATAYRPMTMFMNVGWLKMHAMFLVLRSRPEGFPDSAANDVQNCPAGCRAELWIRMRKDIHGAWILREIAVIKLE